MHKTTKIPISFAKIDNGIAKLVFYLNTFDGIFTRWSCEGDKGKNPLNLPYVKFYAEDVESLRHLGMILQSLGCHADLNTNGSDFMPFMPIAFSIRFDSKKHLKSVFDKIRIT